MGNENDLIPRGDALYALHNDVGLGTSNPAYVCIAALPAAPMGRKAKFLSDQLRAMMDRDPESKMFGLSADVLRHIIEALSEPPSAPAWGRVMGDAQVNELREAVTQYHLALDRRENGNLAGYRLQDEVQRILEMPWRQGTALAAAKKT